MSSGSGVKAERFSQGDEQSQDTLLNWTALVHYLHKFSTENISLSGS